MEWGPRRSRLLVPLVVFVLTSCGGDGGSDDIELLARNFRPLPLVVVGGPGSLTEHSVAGSAAAGRFAIAYRDRDFGSSDVFAQDFGGQADDAGPLLRVDETRYSSTPMIAMNDRGGFVVAWSTNSDLTAILRTGGHLPPASFQVARSPGYLWDVGHANDGAALVVVQRYLPEASDVSGQWFTADAVPQTEFTVGTSVEDSFPAAVRMLDDGSAAIVWNDTRRGMHLGRFDRTGQLVRGPVRVVPGDAESPRLDIAGANLIVVFVEPTYEDEYRSAINLDVKARLFSRDLLPIDEAFPVNARTEGWQRFPTVSAARDGSFVVTWQQGYGYATRIEGISGRRFHRDGAPAGDEFEIPAGGSFASAEPRPFVTVTGDDSFVVVWRQFLGDENRIVAQPFVTE